VKFGVHLGPQFLTIEELRHGWHQTEQLGFDWLSVWDHFYPAAPPFDGPNFEGLACQAAMAVETSKVRLGCLVYCAGYRHPAVLAKAATTIDHLSGGRLELGLGAGWHQMEFEAYGLPFEPPGVRLRRLAESVEVVRLLFTEETADYDGEFYTLRQARNTPKPLQPHPRIWVGARGPKALALAGRLGDGWNVAYVSAAEFAKSAATVREHAGSRPFVTGVNVGLVGDVAAEDKERFLRERFGAAAPVAEATLSGSSAEVIDQVARYAEAGADWLVVALRVPLEPEVLERFATEVIPAFR